MVSLRQAVLLCFLAPFFTSALARAQGTTPSSTVTIPVTEYLNLVKQNERPRFVSILAASVSGRYGEKLKIEVTGQASSLLEKREFLRFDPQNVSFDSCSGAAQVAFESGTASLLPLKSDFSLSCQVSIKNWSQVQFTLIQSMGARADVGGAETLVLTDANGDRQISISKVSGSSRPQENMPISAVGRFRISMLPESTRFEYNLEIENPSRNTRTFEIQFPNDESPSRVTTDTEFTEDERKVSLRLKPGSNQVKIEGAFTQTQFKSPIQGGPHYLLLENHQLLQLTAKSTARLISARDAGLASRFSGQRAYLLQGGDKGEEISWETKKLDVLPSLGFSVEMADYNYFIPTRGHGVVEATFRINNQGQPEIPLPVNGRPLYLEVDGQPQVLATNGQGEILLQLSPGIRNVYFQYEAPTETRSSFGFPTLRLAKPKAVMSQITSRLSFEDGASLLWAQGLSKLETDLFVISGWIKFVLVFALAFYLLGALSLPKSIKIAASIAAGILGALALGFVLMMAVVVAMAALIRFRENILSWLQQLKWTLGKVIGAVVLAGIAGFALLIFSLILNSSKFLDMDASENMAAGMMQNRVQSYGKMSPSSPKGRGGGGSSEGSDGFGGAMSESAPMEDMSFEESDTLAGSASADYQGLPAKVIVPEARRSVHFNRGLIEAEAPVLMIAAYVHPGVPRFLVLISILLWTFLIWRERAQLQAWLRLKKPSA